MRPKTTKISHTSGKKVSFAFSHALPARTLASRSGSHSCRKKESLLQSSFVFVSVVEI